MNLRNIGLLALASCPCLIPSAALADAWVAASVKGVVMTLKGGHWAHLHAQEAVSDAQPIRTLADGRVTFERRGETVAISGDTQMSISQQRGGRYTRVLEWFGSTTVADREQARPHFEVDTPYMAAVVKGTVFKVWTKPGLSGVNVSLGRVEVKDKQLHLHVDVLPGQQASAGTNVPLSVTGTGSLQAIRNVAGQIVKDPAQAGDSVVEAASTAANGNSNAGGNGKGHAGDNGNGNGGDNGSGNAGDSVKGNAGGNGSGNAGGNGSGNAGDNGKGRHS